MKADVLLILTSLTILSACCDASKIQENTKKLYSSKTSEINQALLDLAKCGDKAEAATRKISALLYHENVGIQSSAAYALREIDTPEARKILDSAQKNREKNRN
jgi:HEAT repeat protein